MYFLLPFNVKQQIECLRCMPLGLFVMYERNTYTAQHVINISFIMAVSKFISNDNIKELVIAKDFSYSDVGDMYVARKESRR